MIESGGWVIRDKRLLGSDADTGQYAIWRGEKFCGYYDRVEGSPVFIHNPPRPLSEDMMDELLHLVRAFDEQQNKEAQRKVTFAIGISPSGDVKTKTPEKSRIIIAE